IVKTAAPASVCNGASVTYTYVVTNNSDAFTWTGSLTDDKAGTISASFSLAPGISQTVTARNAITGSATNTATAAGTFKDCSGTSASPQATPSSPTRRSSDLIVKTAAPASVCNGASVTYTYVVTNNSDAFTWTGSLTDDKAGTISASFSLAPGIS